MGQRLLQLDSTYTGNADGTGVLHVSQMPPNPAIFVPGPACKSGTTIGPSLLILMSYWYYSTLCGRQWCSFYRCSSHDRFRSNRKTTSPRRRPPAGIQHRRTQRLQYQRQQSRTLECKYPDSHWLNNKQLGCNLHSLLHIFHFLYFLVTKDISKDIF